MNVTSNSPWTVARIPSIAPEPGLTGLAQFASTSVPAIPSPGSITSIGALQSALQANTDSVRRLDLCPQAVDSQSGQLTIVPFQELPKYVQAGDVVSFLNTNITPAWRQGDLVTMVKQRGWHAEIIAPKQGGLVLHGPWDPIGQVACTPVENVRLHPRYGGCAGDWNLHICRFSPPNDADKARFSALMKGLEGWSTIFPQTTWPSDMAFNPILFSDVASLRANVGDKLIQKVSPPPRMFCIEWVNAVFSLACCYPLTKSFLSSRNMLQAMLANFPGVTLLDDSVEAFEALPWAAYHPSYIIESFLDTYFEEDLSEDVVAALPGVAQIPSPVIMPIVPLLEARKKSSPSNFNVSYVCTAVADEWCVPSA